MTAPSALLKLLTIAALCSSLPAFAGSGTSGGGTAVKDARTGRLVLLDFVTEIPGFDPTTQDPVYAPDKIAATPFAMTVGYDRVKARNLPAYATAAQRLNAWQAGSPVIVGLIRSALDGMDWVFTPYRQEVCAIETLPGRFGRDALYSAVVYNEQFGARMSLPVVNRLGHSSMTGLLVHEALRHVEIAYEDGMSDETIRRVTAKIIFSNPQAGESLDRPEWYGNKVASVIVGSQSSQALHDEACAYLSKHGMSSELCTGEHAVHRTLSIEEIGKLDEALFAHIMATNPAPSYSDQEKQDLFMALDIRGRLDNESADRALAGLQGASINLVDPGHQLGQVFQAMTEDALRKYIAGDHSGFGPFQKLKINGAISDAQQANQKALQSGTVLSCPR